MQDRGCRRLGPALRLTVDDRLHALRPSLDHPSHLLRRRRIERHGQQARQRRLHQRPSRPRIRTPLHPPGHRVDLEPGEGLAERRRRPAARTTPTTAVERRPTAVRRVRAIGVSYRRPITVQPSEEKPHVPTPRTPATLDQLRRRMRPILPCPDEHPPLRLTGAPSNPEVPVATSLGGLLETRQDHRTSSAHRLRRRPVVPLALRPLREKLTRAHLPARRPPVPSRPANQHGQARELPE